LKAYILLSTKPGTSLEVVEKIKEKVKNKHKIVKFWSNELAQTCRRQKTSDRLPP